MCCRLFIFSMSKSFKKGWSGFFLSLGDPALPRNHLQLFPSNTDTSQMKA